MRKCRNNRTNPIFKKDLLKNRNQFRFFFVLLAGSVLFALANPNFLFSDGLPFLAWGCFVPVFWTVHKCSLKSAWIWGFFYGFFSYALLVFWLYNYSPLIFVIAILFSAFCCAILFGVLKFSDFVCEKAGLKNIGWILNCLFLISFEYVKTKGGLGFSYGIIGYTQWKNIPLIQIAGIAGVYGVSVLIVFFSGILCEFVIRLELRRKANLKIDSERKDGFEKTSFFGIFIAAGLWILLVFAVFVYGKVTEASYDEFEKIKIAAIQSNENSREDGIDSYKKNIKKLISLTDEAVASDSDTKIIVWPETSVVPSIMYQYYFGADSRRIELINNLLEYIDNKEQAFVIGNFHREKGSDGKPRDYNSALVFTPKKNVVPPDPEHYCKMRLVPISEEFPFADKFPKIKGKLEKLGASFWNKGEECTVFELENEGFCFSTPICFENTFPEIARDMCKAGSKCLISLTNDSWAKSSAAQNQHLAMAVFRSVENKIPGVISATSGVTCAINPDGKILGMAEQFSESYLVSEIPVIPKNQKSAFYTKYGDIICNLSVFMSFALLIIGLIICIIKICRNRQIA